MASEKSFRRVLRAAAVVFSAAAFSGCIPYVGEDTGESWLCRNGDVVETPAGVGVVQQGLSARLETLWTTTRIPVCWEQSTIDSTSAADRAVVREAVESTWQQALATTAVPEDARIRFVGWSSCASDAAAATGGIRIQVADVRPGTVGLGSQLAGVPGAMALNFTFKKWNDSCSRNEDDRRTCIYNIAVHEFGHALGLAHEHLRTDTPETCTEERTGSQGNYSLGIWDGDSVMNYCNPRWNNDGFLSFNDASGIRSLYYPKLAAEFCAEPARESLASASEIGINQDRRVSGRRTSGRAAASVPAEPARTASAGGAR
jgi:hypothetical protein